MLDIANKYTDQLNKLFMTVAYDDKYKFINCGYSNLVYKPRDDNWTGNDFVSLDSNGNVIGYMSYEINRQSWNVSGFVAMNFSNNKSVFGKDLLQMIADIFLKFNFQKIRFCVYVGNPIEESYNRLVRLSGGRVVGTCFKDRKLSDGLYYDSKEYEILREDFVQSMFYLKCRNYIKRREKLCQK